MTENNKLPMPLGMGGIKQPPSAEQMKQMLEGLKLLKGANEPKHEPILKSLEKLGIPLRTKDISGETHIVFPLQELIDKEYAFVTGIDLAGVREQANHGRIDLGKPGQDSTIND
jgi:hypothetical protein